MTREGNDQTRVCKNAADLWQIFNTGIFQPSALSVDPGAQGLCMPALDWQGGTWWRLWWQLRRWLWPMVISKVMTCSYVGAPGGGCSCSGRRAGRCHLLPQSNLLEAGSPGFKGNNVMINLCRAWVHHGTKTTLTLDSLMEDVAPPCGRSIFPLVECALCILWHLAPNSLGV